MDSKCELRSKLRKRRQHISSYYKSDPEVYYSKLKTYTLPALHTIIRKPGTCVSGFFPIQSEIDCLFLLQKLKPFYKLALPVVLAPNEPLIFREWDGNVSSLVKGKYGIRVPPAHSPEVAPRVVITSLFGYTTDKFRLGFGGGYYDRTFENLDCIKIGLCFKEQWVNSFNKEAHDVPMDFIITEDGAALEYN